MDHAPTWQRLLVTAACAYEAIALWTDLPTITNVVHRRPWMGDAHCTEDRYHRYSCYDAGEDVSFNHRQDFRHDCEDPSCDRPHFTNEGD